MLRTSRPSNYWGLVQQRGPWEETAIDLQRLKRSRTINIGGGVDDGGTTHAGHAQWSTTMTPWPQYASLPPCPNPSTYAQIANLIPGPPQRPPRPGRFPEYIFGDPNQEKQGSFHIASVQPTDPSESIPTPSDPKYDERMKQLTDAKSKRDLVTGPFGHQYDVLQHPEIYTQTPEIWPHETLNTPITSPATREPRTSLNPKPRPTPHAPISYSQMPLSASDRTIPLSTGETLTVPSIYEARLRTGTENSPETYSMYPPDAGFVADLAYQLKTLNTSLKNQILTFLSSSTTRESQSYQQSLLYEYLTDIKKFYTLLGINTSQMKVNPTGSPQDFATSILQQITTLNKQIYAHIPPIPTDTITQLTGLPNEQDELPAASTTRSLMESQPSIQQISATISSGNRYSAPEYVITTPLTGQMSSPSLGHQLINAVGAVATPLQQLSQAAQLNHQIFQTPNTSIAVGDRLEQLDSLRSRVDARKRKRY